MKLNITNIVEAVQSSTGVALIIWSVVASTTALSAILSEHAEPWVIESAGVEWMFSIVVVTLMLYIGAHASTQMFRLCDELRETHG